MGAACLYQCKRGDRRSFRCHFVLQYRLCHYHGNRIFDGYRFGFAFVDARTDALLGAGGLNRFDPVNRWANLGYWVRTSAAGRGVATAAVGLITRFGFEVVGLQRIEIVAAVANAASRRVAEKTGAHLEGVARNRLFLRGAGLDAAVYGLVP